MKETDDQIKDWLKKLERESWQLELLVSAFTIFLLIQGAIAFDEFITDVQVRYNLNAPFMAVGYIMLMIIQNSLKALTIFLIVHLMMRGFWIGTIGLRSVQSSIDLKKFNYSEFFTKKLEDKMISLDQMVIRLDEICSVIFSFAFLVISILISFGLFFCFIALTGVLLGSVKTVLPESLHMAHNIAVAVLMAILILSGLIYMIDYFTLGFFKKYKRISKIYYPMYKLYHYVTLAALSKSIYYYMIGKFSKRRIRVLYLIIGAIVMASFMFQYDQYQYFPQKLSAYQMSANAYDDQREDDYVIAASIPSNIIKGPFMPLYIRYNPADNALARTHCPDFEPLMDDGLNWNLRVVTGEGNFLITRPDFANENSEQLLRCLSQVYQVVINDHVYGDLNFHFYRHPSKNQKGLYTMIPTDTFQPGENKLIINQVGETSLEQYAYIPFWFSK